MECRTTERRTLAQEIVHGTLVELRTWLAGYMKAMLGKSSSSASLAVNCMAWA